MKSGMPLIHSSGAGLSLTATSADFGGSSGIGPCPEPTRLVGCFTSDEEEDDEDELFGGISALDKLVRGCRELSSIECLLSMIV
jgi:hypothetical protein